MQNIDPNMVASRNQHDFAAELGVEFDEDTTVDTLVHSIEYRLGQANLLEQSRWYLLSVLRHTSKAQWQQPASSGIDIDTQYEMAREYIICDNFKKSLRTVLKDSRCKFTLLKFAKGKDVKKRTLSSSTQAFRRARSLLEEAGLSQAKKERRKSAPAFAPTVATEPSAEQQPLAEKQSLAELQPAVSPLLELYPVTA